MDDMGYHEFMSDPDPKEGASFYWPVAPGESWYPNIRRWNDPAEPHPYWTPRDLVHILARPLRQRIGGGNILYWYISIIGGDDHSVTTRYAGDGKWGGHRMSVQEVKAILNSMPNPLSQAWVESRVREGRPLFRMD